MPETRPLVAAGEDPKTGCLWCPLLPWSSDFDHYRLAYQRDAAKILSKEPDGHVVRSRCVAQEWSKVDILFVLDAPAFDEDRKGVPVTGRSANLLDEVVNDLNKSKQLRVGFTNVVRCRPPRNRDAGRTEIQSCLPELVREVEVRDPKLIVALGNAALSVLVGRSGITALNGKLLEATHPKFAGRTVLACVSPAYVLRFDHELARFLEAMSTAWEYVLGEHKPKSGAGEYYTLTELEDVRAVFEAFESSANPVAFDTETGGLTWWQTQFPKLLCFSFSDEDGFGYVVPFDHADSPWRIGGPQEAEREQVASILRRFFASDKPKIAQNGQFDCKHILAALDVFPANVTDTMTMHLTLDERRGTHGLDALAFAYTGMGGYDAPLEQYKKSHTEANPERGGSYANIPGSILFEYAAADADVTVRVYNALKNSDDYSSNPKFQALAERFFPALSETLARMEYAGAKIDVRVIEQLDREYVADMTERAYGVSMLDMVRKYVRETGIDALNLKSPKQLQEILYSPKYYGATPPHLTKTGLERLKQRYEKLAGSRSRKSSGAPTFTDIWRSAIAAGEYQHFSTDGEAMQELDLAGVELASKIVEYRAVATLHGTFVKPIRELLDADSRVHGNFSIAGTVTGRLASYDPNLQNIPNKGDGRIKRAYVSRFASEGLIFQADYSQIELRVAASLFDEPTMLRLYRENSDVHTATALDISKLTPEQYSALDSADKKQWRTRAKRVNFGVLYQGGPAALVKTLKKDGVFITEKEAEDLIERFFRARPALKRGIERLKQSVLRDGYIESVTGRRRRVPEVRSADESLVAQALRQSVNFPIQSSASDMTLMSLVLIDREMRARDLRSVLILSVHDSLVIDCHVDELREVGELVKSVMEHLPERSRGLLPDLDWSWLRCPIVAELEVGTSWGTGVPWTPDGDLDDLWDRMAEAAS